MAEGIIFKAVSGFYYVKPIDGSSREVYSTVARGRFRLDKTVPLVGDRVRFDITQGSKGILTEILPRKNTFIRPPLANIDIMVIIASAAIPVADPYLIDKMTVIACKNNCKPVICINKLDIDSAEELVALYKTTGFSVIRTSTVTLEGIDELIDVISGSVSAFCGNSGVGKSSILNAIDPDFKIATGDVSRKLGRGRHTTRHTELFELSCGALVADTPGFSAFDTGYIAAKEDIQYMYPEFQPFIGKCRFDDCAHISEPDCAVLTALKQGIIHNIRHNNYKLMYLQASEYKSWEDKPVL